MQSGLLGIVKRPPFLVRCARDETRDDVDLRLALEQLESRSVVVARLPDEFRARPAAIGYYAGEGPGGRFFWNQPFPLKAIKHIAPINGVNVVFHEALDERYDFFNRLELCINTLTDYKCKLRQIELESLSAHWATVNVAIERYY